MNKQLKRGALLALLLFAGLVFSIVSTGAIRTATAKATIAAGSTPTMQIFSFWGRVQGKKVAVLASDFSELPQGATEKVNIGKSHLELNDIQLASMKIEVMRKGPTWWWLKMDMPQFSVNREAFPYPSGSCFEYDGDVDCDGSYINDMEIGMIDLTNMSTWTRWRRAEYFPTNHIKGNYDGGIIDPNPPIGSKVVYGQTEVIGSTRVTSIMRIITPLPADTDLRIGVVVVDCGGCPARPQ